MKKWVTYIIQSQQPAGILYTGMSGDVLKRLAAHNSKGGGAKFTKRGRPWKLVYVEVMPNKSAALRYEFQIKQMTRAQKLRLIRHSNLAEGLAQLAQLHEALQAE